MVRQGRFTPKSHRFNNGTCVARFITEPYPAARRTEGLNENDRLSPRRRKPKRRTNGKQGRTETVSTGTPCSCSKRTKSTSMLQTYLLPPRPSPRRVVFYSVGAIASPRKDLGYHGIVSVLHKVWNVHARASPDRSVRLAGEAIECFLRTICSLSVCSLPLILSCNSAGFSSDR